MKIGIIGAGNIGGTAARLFVDAGHDVAIGNSRGPETLREFAAGLGPSARAVTAAEAAQFGDVVLVAIPLKGYRSLPAAELHGKIVIDAMNYYPNRDGNIRPLDAHEKTSSQLVAEHLAGARVVKAFNTIWSEHLKAQGKKDLPIEQRRAIFVSADDAEARQIVSSLIEEIGFGPYVLGSLADSAAQQPGAAVYNRELTVADARAAAPR